MKIIGRRGPTLSELRQQVALQPLMHAKQRASKLHEMRMNAAYVRALRTQSRMLDKMLLARMPLYPKKPKRVPSLIESLMVPKAMKEPHQLFGVPIPL